MDKNLGQTSQQIVKLNSIKNNASIFLFYLFYFLKIDLILKAHTPDAFTSPVLLPQVVSKKRKPRV